ncbi:isopenicillin N synthase family dioxygenase [Lichenifustis flavocetrariae]|uniref:2-oxoglutarate-dependent ethylene/succinate-forming enzyme n=1 Tax=Lichenifustis flavocetrariae TaxID=2949735 RepID=A0AA41Z5J2_9HYPH|nr:2OG-Fe(II) oxygenase family protein [Lichenifustis flavocetrariae]MCW6509672.1 isopenicillin N synthase family oxygenase [Lichenifustis flavocetrariae]
MSATRTVKPVSAGDETIDRLPIVDLQNFAFDEAGADRIAKEIDRIFSETGFCYLSNTGVSDAEIARIFEASKAFHALPQADKEAVAINAYHRGYMAPKTSLIVTSSVATVTKPNNSESLMIMHEIAGDDPRFGQDLQGPNQWPDKLPAFRADVQEYVDAMLGLARRFTTLIARALGMAPDALDHFFARPTTFLRLLHYPPQPNAADDEFGSAPHTDYGFITILLQDGVGGLEVRRRGGGWIKATPVPGTFVINVGDILARWTNGRWQSTPHRVQNKNTVDRYSVPFFFDPDMSETITCLPGCVAANEAPRFEPIVYGKYLMERIDKNYSYRNAAGGAA